jgi:actin-like ATPase involved in cell morphogenesis
VILGIDFGTFSCKGGYMRAGELHWINSPSGAGHHYLSSACVDEAGELLVADAAESHRHCQPEAYWSEFKLELSRRQLHLGSRRLTSVDLTCALMRALRSDADHQTSSPAVGAVLGVPPRFLEHSRSLLVEACHEAGFAQVSLVSEPVAAVNYHAWLNGAGSGGDIVLVYDLGGGSCSSALVLRSGTGRLEVLDHFETAHISGRCFDRLLYQEMVQRLARQDGLADRLLAPGSQDPASHRAQVELLLACRRAKEALSEDQEYAVEVASLGLEDEPVRLDADELKQLIRPHLLEGLRDCHELFTRAGVSARDVSAVLVTGGGARIPWLGPLVANELGIPLLTVDDPELAVSAGAAIEATQDGAKRGPRLIVPVATLPRQGAAPAAGVFAPNGGALVTGLWGRKITLNGYPEGDVIRSIDVGELWLSAIALTADGRLMATAGAGRHISIWNLADGALRVRLHGHKDRVCALAFVGDPATLVSASDDGTVQTWDLDAGRATRAFDAGGQPRGCAVGAHGQWVATATGSKITGWTLSSGGQSFAVGTPHDGGVSDLAVNAAGTVIAAAGMDGNVSLWDSRSDSPLQVIEAHKGPVRCVEFGDGLLATGGADAAIRVWDARTGELLNTLSEHTSAVRFLCFDSTGLRLASGSVDGTVQLWRIVSE